VTRAITNERIFSSEEILSLRERIWDNDFIDRRRSELVVNDSEIFFLRTVSEDTVIVNHVKGIC